MNKIYKEGKNPSIFVLCSTCKMDELKSRFKTFGENK